MKIGGERAYRLARKGIVVEMPLRATTVHALEVVAYSGDSVQLELHVSSGTYIRAIAASLGGHCTTLRRTSVGPFSVEEADPERIIPPSLALARLSSAALARVTEQVRSAVLAVEEQADSARAGRP